MMAIDFVYTSVSTCYLLRLKTKYDCQSEANRAQDSGAERHLLLLVPCTVCTLRQCLTYMRNIQLGNHTYAKTPALGTLELSPTAYEIPTFTEYHIHLHVQLKSKLGTHLNIVCHKPPPTQ